MDFTLPEELHIVRDTVERFVKHDLEPISMQVEENGTIPDNIILKMKELGFFGITIPQE